MFSGEMARFRAPTQSSMIKLCSRAASRWNDNACSERPRRELQMERQVEGLQSGVDELTKEMPTNHAEDVIPVSEAN